MADNAADVVDCAGGAGAFLVSLGTWFDQPPGWLTAAIAFL